MPSSDTNSPPEAGLILVAAAGTSEDISTVRPPTSNSRVDQAIQPAASTVPTGRLVMLAQDGTARRVIQLSGETMDLGQSEGDIILSEDMYLSARHARFTGRNGGRTLIDLGSLNGIYLRIRGMAVLTDGDLFLVGLQLLKFELELGGMADLAPIRVAGCSLFGSSTSPRYARLSERTIDGAPRSVFVVGRDETILGREVGDIVFSGDPFMSRRHAALTRDPTDGTFTLRDLGSSNGTFLRVRGKVDLEPGDHLRIGQHLFRYEMDHP
jgi:pSer/pThr/pTyr-binding forkhead associated (FHA) protein